MAQDGPLCPVAANVLTSSKTPQEDGWKPRLRPTRPRGHGSYSVKPCVVVIFRTDSQVPSAR